MRLQARAAITGFLFFFISSALLFVLARGIANVAAVLPLPHPLPGYAPGQTVAALLDLRPVVALGAGVLLAAALVLVLNSGYLDRSVQMLASMVTLVLASIIGIIAGFGLVLSVSTHHLAIPAGALPALVSFVVALVASSMPMARLRASLLTRSVIVLGLLIGSPLLLIFAS